MLLFDQLYDTIVVIFIEHQKLTTQELHKHINKKTTISLPNLYKIIGKLLDEQILIKEAGKLSLHSRRIGEFCETADKLKKTYFETS